MGQDPYPNPAHPIGLSFAVERHVWPLPPSLLNIYVELRDDLGIVPPRHGDLSAWADQGVMLLNRTLTVRPGDSNSHQGKGWEPITERAIAALAERGGPCAAVLWGRHAQKLKPLLGEVPCVESAHPSPLSARRGFFGSQALQHGQPAAGGAGRRAGRLDPAGVRRRPGAVVQWRTVSRTARRRPLATGLPREYS